MLYFPHFQMNFKEPSAQLFSILSILVLEISQNQQVQTKKIKKKNEEEKLDISKVINLYCLVLPSPSSSS